MSYNTLFSIKYNDFSERKALIIGAGWMAREYGKALQALGVKEICFIGRGEISANQCGEIFRCESLCGGYEKTMPGLNPFDLVIVATPIHELTPAAIAAIECGQLNILVEKPGSLYAEELEKLRQKAVERGARVRIAYNRMTYLSYWKLKELIQEDGGITSCRYTFTELIRSIDFEKDREDVYRRWGIANSLHVIGMAHSLIGMPKELCARQQGGLSWHPTGSVFVGAGITDKDIPFSYHADWTSAGRWGIEIMTPEYAYRLIPLEKLYRSRRGTFDWEAVEFEPPFPEIKDGVCEQLSLMLTSSREEEIALTSLEKAKKAILLAERIFGYSALK